MGIGVAIFVFLGIGLAIFWNRFFSFPYRSVLQRVSQGVVIFDQKQKIFFKNQEAEALFPDSDIEQEAYHFLQHFLIQQETFKAIIKINAVDYLIHKWKEGRYQIIAFELSEQKRVHQMGRDFVANASHELRTPITIIKGFAETLQDMPVISDAMLHDFTDKILRSCQRMDNLVKNLLLLADLDHAKRIHLRPSDLLGLIESVSYTVLGLHPDLMIETLTSHEEIIFPFDPDLLEQALINLLENAVKYSPRPAMITITAEKKAEGVVLKIQDQGFGIAKEHLPYIFQRFYRVNQDRSRKLGGAGLGLSIVEAIIHKHHGTIQVDSELSKGTTFELFFTC